MCRKHVHSTCDPEATEEKILERRAVQFNYMYVCKICKGQQTMKGPGAMAGNCMAAPLSRAYDDPASMETVEDVVKGKPLNAVAEARKKLLAGSSKGTQPKPAYTWSAQQGLPGPGGTFDLTSTLAEKKKRVAEIRARRGRTPKYKGMVGLSKPQGDPSVKEDEAQEESKMIICSLNDDFVLKQDICVMCGSLGNDLEGRLIACAQCGQCYHPHCVNVKVTKVILQKGWRCLDCTVCEGCGKKHDEANLILCDDCDISYHIYCTDPPLDHVPDGSWKCKWCSICQYCGTGSPGVNSGWFDNYSTCGPCMSLQQCPLCEEAYEDGELIVTCTACNRWCHGECDSIQTEEDAEKCFEAGYTCQLCRPDNTLPPHLAMRDEDERAEALALTSRKTVHRPPSPPMSPDYPVYGGYYNTASYMLDGVMLSERGMQHLKSLTIEKDKRMRKRRLGGADAFINPLDPHAGPSHDNSLEGDDDDDDDAPPPTPGGSGLSGGTHKDGEIVKPLPDGSAPTAPEGFTIVVKDNGLMVLRKRRYRDLKKVGIGGFQAKVRTPKGQKGKPVEEENTADDDPNKKKRVAWRPKKNKILVQYPEYIQDAFFGKDFMAKCPEKVDDEETLPSPDKRRVHTKEDGKTIHLNKDALFALEEMKAKEEAERKEREAKEEEARAAIEAAAKVAADKARIAQEELEALKKEASEEGESSTEKKGVKEEEMTEEEDIMLPSDLFGDDIFSSIFKGDGNNIDIDEAALDEAEEVDGNNEKTNTEAMEINKELSAGLQDMLGPNFDAKDMEDIFDIAANDTAKESSEVNPDQQEVKTEPTEASSSVPTETNPPQAEIKSELLTPGQEMMPPQSLQDPTPETPAIKQEPLSAQPQQLGGSGMPGDLLAPGMTGAIKQESVDPQPLPGQPGGGNVPHASPQMQQQQQMSPNVMSGNQQQLVINNQPQPGMSPQMHQHSTGIQQQQQQQAGNIQQQQQVGNIQQQQQQQQLQQQHQLQQQRQMLQQQQQQQQQPRMAQSGIMNPAQQQSGMMQQQQQAMGQQMQPGMMQAQMRPGLPQQQMQQGVQQPGMQPQAIPQSSMQPGQPGMPQQQLHQPVMQQQRPGMPQQQQIGVQQPIMNTGMRPQMPPAMQQQQQMRPGFINQQGPMLQQQQMVGQQQMLTQNMMPGGQRMVMGQQGLMQGQMIRGQMVQPGGQIVRGQMMGQGGQMQPQQQPQQQQQPAAQPAPPAAKEPSSQAQNQLQKWVADEPLGENATIAMILYANINHADLKHNYPKWEERVKQIAKIWKNLPNEKRQPYVTKARENRTASRMNRGPVSRFYITCITSHLLPRSMLSKTPIMVQTLIVVGR